MTKKKSTEHDALKAILELAKEKDVTPKSDEKMTFPDDDGMELKAIDLKNTQTRSAMLDFVFRTSTTVANEIINGERQKRRFRKRLIISLTVILAGSLLFAATMIVLDSCGKINLPTEIFIAFITVIIAQTVSLMTLFVRHATDTKPLELYNTTMKMVLEYLNKSDYPQTD